MDIADTLSMMWPAVSPGSQFGGRSGPVNVALGRIIRHLDTTNGDERDVLKGLCRLLIALRVADFPSSVLRVAVKKAHRSAWLDFSPALEVALGDFVVALLWAQKYDLVHIIIRHSCKSLAQILLIEDAVDNARN